MYSACEVTSVILDTLIDFHVCMYVIVIFTVNRLTENFRLTGLSINRTETGNMAAALSVDIFYTFVQ